MGMFWPSTEGRVQYISHRPSDDWAAGKRVLTLLGSTGSIGTSTLKTVAAMPEMFDVAALACARNVTKLAQQAKVFRPRYLGVLDEDAAERLLPLLPEGYKPEIAVGPEGYARLASLPEINTVLSAQVGAAGLRGTVAAVLAGKVVCLANKESLVLAGDLVRAVCALTGASILPVDSEHNAVFQCLAGRPGNDVSRIILTASGGPFRGRKAADLAGVTAAQALRHPNWSMGAKITIDSATLMNKGLEIIEACHLYGLPLDMVDVLVHPQSVIHSLAEFNDGSQAAQLSTPDMRTAIANCLAWPHFNDCGVRKLDLAAVGSLTFERPDEETFACLNLARRAFSQGTGACVVLNAANEVAVDAFLNGLCSFTDIADSIAATLRAMPDAAVPELAVSAGGEDLNAAAAEIVRQIETVDAAARAHCSDLLGTAQRRTV